jgi:hypothetical protein
LKQQRKQAKNETAEDDQTPLTARRTSDPVNCCSGPEVSCCLEEDVLSDECDMDGLLRMEEVEEEKMALEDEVGTRLDRDIVSFVLLTLLVDEGEEDCSDSDGGSDCEVDVDPAARVVIVDDRLLSLMMSSFCCWW